MTVQCLWCRRRHHAAQQRWDAAPRCEWTWLSSWSGDAVSQSLEKVQRRLSDSFKSLHCNALGVSGVTREGWCHLGRQLMVSPCFFFKKTDTFWKVMIFFSCRVLTTPISHVVYPVFFLNSATKKIILFGCHPLDGVTRGTPSDATARG